MHTLLEYTLAQNVVAIRPGTALQGNTVSKIPRKMAEKSDLRQIQTYANG
jgi:hypothetical protein